MRYEIHFTIECDDDVLVERAVNGAHDRIEKKLDGAGTMSAQAYQRPHDDGPPKPTGWHDWDADADESFYRRRD